MRPLTLLDTVVDECGVPLNGRLKVFVRGETATATIYDADENEIANPQQVVNGITARQIFIPDIDVTVEVQVLVDEAFPGDDDSWECVRRIVDTYPTFDVTNDSDGLYIVNSTTELRELDPSVVQSKIGVKVATLMSSELPPLNYRYIAGYGYNDNDGDVVSYLDGSVGKWVAMFDKDYVDCRYFGIRAKGGLSSITGQDATRIPSFLNRCAYLGKSPYFPADMTNAYYNIGNNTVAGAKTDVGTVFCNLNGQTATVSDTDVKCYSAAGFGTVNVVSDVVRTSQNVGSSKKVVLKPRIKAVLDSQYFADFEWKGVELSVNVDQEFVKAKNCQFIGDHVIDGGSLSGCSVPGNIFSEDFDFVGSSISNCSTDIRTWSDTDAFVAFSLSNSEYEIDLRGNTITEISSEASGTTLYNAVVDVTGFITEGVKFNGCTFRNAVKGKFWNCVDCTFENGLTVTTDNSNNTSGEINGYFYRCSFVNQTQIHLDFGISPNDSLSIGSLIIDGCIFGYVSPLTAVHSETTDNYVKRLDISGMEIVNCVGSTWSTDEFVVQKSMPTTGTRGVDGQDILPIVEMPFTSGSARWEMEFGVYSEKTTEGGTWNLSETNKKNYCGSWDMLNSSNTHTSSTETGSPLNAMIAYAKIRRIK